MFYSSIYRFFCFLLAVIAVAGADDETNSLGRHLLKVPEVKLFTRLMTQAGSTILAYEYYSNHQQRARLELGKENPITYYYDESNSKRLLQFTHNETVTECKTCFVSNLANNLFGALSQTDEKFSGESWQDMGSTIVPAHIVGPARILFIIDQTRQFLRDPKKQMGFNNGQEAIAYDYVNSELNDLKITVYFADSDQHKTGNDLPTRVVMRTRPGSRLMIDFYLAHEVHQDSFDQQKELDMFSFPIGQGCSAELSRTAPPMSDWFVHSEIMVASYLAKVEEYTYADLPNHLQAEYEVFQAYDHYANVMRVDTIQLDKYQTDIHDFNLKLKYKISYETQKGKEQILDETNKYKPSNEPKCQSAPILPRESYGKFPDFYLMVQMGRATIRGLECMVFEQVTEDLSPTLFSYLNYRDESDTGSAKQASKQDDTQPYSVVYFFVAQNFEPEPRLSYREFALGPLVHVDVYRFGNLRYSLEITNFVYQLSNAPNGDEQIDLFAVGCGAKTHAEVKFELHHRRTGIAAGEVAQILKGSAIRNKAILRAISSPIVSATMIHDLESSVELIDKSNELVMHGSCILKHADADAVAECSRDGFWSKAYKSLSGRTIYLTLDEGEKEGSVTNEDGNMEFRVEQLEIIAGRYSSSLDYTVATIDGKHSSTAKGELLNGIGLTPASGQLERTEGANYGVCHSICMANLSCVSYSVCLAANGFECISSDVNLADPILFASIDVERKKLLTVERHHIVQIANPTNDQTIELEVDVRCKSYKKDSLEMFSLELPIRAELRDTATYSVDGPGECAELCLKSNLAFFETMSQITLRTSAVEVMSEYTSNLARWCSSFRYLNLFDHSLSVKQLAKKITPSKLNKAGLCSLMRPLLKDVNRMGSDETKDDTVKVELKQYRFLYTGLYESHYGRKMKGATDSIRLWASEPETCARTCFLQTSSLRPWCKSFDFIKRQSIGESHCVLYSLSSSDAPNLIDDLQLDSEVTIWHYEPRDTFSIHSLASTNIANVPAELKSDSHLKQASDGGAGNSSYGLMLSIVMAALLYSCWLVASKGDTIVDGLDKRYSSAPAKRIRFKLPDHIDLVEIASK